MKSLYRDWSPFIAFVLLGICLLLMFKRCDSPQPAITAIPELKVKDSFRVVIKYHDSTRVKTILTHRAVVKTVLKDSTKCYTDIVRVVESCEKVIYADSILITSLKANIANDSVIIFKQGLMLRADSLQICKLNKKVKRNKIIAKVAFITGLIGGGVAGVKLVN